MFHQGHDDEWLVLKDIGSQELCLRVLDQGPKGWWTD